MITFELPYPPSVNHYWRTVRGRPIISRDGREYRERVNRMCSVINPETLPRKGLIVTVAAYPPDKRRRDLDNILKALLDSMQHAGIYEDDSMIDDLRIVRKGVYPSGRVLVTIN